MNDPREFDELARQKLAQRQFAFKEGDWAGMQRLINDQGKKRRWPLWTLAAVLLVATPALWWALRDEPATIAPAAPAIARVEEASVKGTAPLDVASNSTATEQTDRKVYQPVHEAIAPTEPVAAAEQEPAQQARARTADEPAHREPAKRRTRNTSAVMTGTGVSSAEVKVKTSNASATAVVQAGTPTGQHATAGTKGVAIAGVVDEVAAPTGVNISAVPPTNDTAVMPDTSPTSTTSTPANTGSTESTNIVPLNSGTVAPSADSVQTAVVTQDSALVPPAPTPTQWLATSGSRFEFSLFGGMSLSTSRYSATSAETWRTDNSGQWSPSFGFEAMRMKEHFGYGLGVHRARYEEQLRAEQLSRTDDIYTTTYFLMPIQIITPVVTDTLTVDSVDYFVTTPTTVTVNQLMSNTDTTQQNTILREARTVVNRVDYWEVPLLVDLHTSKGRWCFGVRGGPSIGFLSVRSGVVPNAEGDGYADLGGSTYRSTLFGYQARIYARYRLSDRWSIGLEPIARGHFGNAFEGGSPVRRNMAVGGLFSLTFRLP
jgi:hypothetical protein